MIRALIFSCLVLAALPAYAQNIPAWVIDAEKSSIVFTATQQGALIEGRFGKFTGDIRFDASRPGESNATIKIQLASVDSQSPDRDGSLIGPDWFATESFPESIYTVSKFEKINEKQYLARGILSLRDIQKPLDLPLTITFSTDSTGNQVALAEGEVTLNRLDFGVGQGEWEDTQSVGNPVKVKVSVTAVQSKPAP